jgi:hypothetical protein
MPTKLIFQVSKVLMLLLMLLILFNISFDLRLNPFEERMMWINP